jgi:hypothetical protein
MRAFNMTITKKSFSNLYESEVYRELERQAVRKGFFELTPTQSVKLAHQQITIDKNINKKPDCTPSNDLVLDIARLAYAMKRKGFDKVAEDIENNLIIYKRAESAMYNIKVDDVANFAHRDGDVDIIGRGDLGIIETIQSAAEKILAVVKKEPKRVSAEKNASLIIRRAQAAFDPNFDDGETPATTNTEKSGQATKVESAYKFFNDYISTFPKVSTTSDMLFRAGRLQGNIARLYQKFTGIDLNTIENVENAYKMLYDAGQTDFSAEGYKQTIEKSKNDASVIRDKICPVLGISPVYFSGVSKHQMDSKVIPEGELPKIIEQVERSNKAFKKDSKIAPLNEYSVYIQVIQETDWNGITPGIYTDKAKVETLANQMAAKTKEVFASCYGNDNAIIANANDKMMKLPIVVSDKVSHFKLSVPTTAIGDNGIIVGDVVFGVLNNNSTGLKKYLNTGDGALLRRCFIFFGQPDPLRDFVGGIDAAVEKSEENLNSFVKDKGFDRYKPDLNSLTTAIKYWDGIANNDSSPDKDKAKVIAGRLNTLFTVLKENNNQPWKVVQEALGKIKIVTSTPTAFNEQLSKITTIPTTE